MQILTMPAEGLVLAAEYSARGGSLEKHEYRRCGGSDAGERQLAEWATILRAHHSLLPLSFVALLVLLSRRHLSATTASTRTLTGSEAESTESPAQKERSLIICAGNPDVLYLRCRE
jgi:hypothetical protein